jgi:hypothetical protein
VTPRGQRLGQDSPSQASALALDTMTRTAGSAMLGGAAAGAGHVVSLSQLKRREVFMEQTKEFSVTLDDRPGTLAKATDAIAKAGINIEGYCAVPSGKDGKGTFRVVTKDPSNTRKALETAGFKVQEERDIAVIEAEDRPGFLAQVLRRLAENEVNVGPSYSITQNRIAISSDNFAKLREFLQEMVPTSTRR